MPRTALPWLSLGFDLWALGVESADVITRRGAKLALGDAAAAAEAGRMVAEKIDAALELQQLALRGALGRTPHGIASATVRRYRRKVRANRRRLARRPAGA